MESLFVFVFNSILLGVALAMDAFSVSLANGLNEPDMRKERMAVIAGTFAFFQWLMPMIGWVLVHTIVEYFSVIDKFIPWIALGLLGYIGINMIRERNEEQSEVKNSQLFMQGIATSIDALSVGLTIADYDFTMAMTASLIIMAVTFIICIGGLILGRKFGMKLAGKASVLGGCILIFIGLEIFIKSFL